MRDNILNISNIRKNKDKEILNKVESLNSTISDYKNFTSINSVEEFNQLNFYKEKICISLDKEGIFIYRIKDDSMYYLSNSLLYVFNNSTACIISYNIKDVLRRFSLFDAEVKYCWDCYIAARVLDENITDVSLNSLYKKYSNGKDSQDAIKIYKLYVSQNKLLNEENKELQDLYYKIELPCIRVIFNIENNGIKIDSEYLNTLLSKYSRKDYDYRYLTKLKDSVDNNYIHSTINQYAAVTGRMSIRNPNLQNIPATKEARDIFIPNDGNIFISADYSQQEIRILAELSKDKTMQSIFDSGEDIYSKLASILFNKSYEECLEKNNKDIRTKAKRVLLSIIYGVGSQTLSEELNCSIDEVEKIRDNILDIFENIQPFENKTIDEAKSNKCVSTIFGRKRRFKEFNSYREYRQAINSRIQGTGADILKFVLIKLYNNKEIKNLGVKILLPLHDEILFECPIENREAAQVIIRDIMENSFSSYLHVPMKCDIIYLNKWGTVYSENKENL